MPPALRAALESAYRELDGEILALGVGCWERGDCCEFERCDHRLFASSVEIAYVAQKHAPPLPARGVLCPFWSAGKCTERERRPLGCRTYFCDRRYREQLQALYEKYHRRLQELAVEHGSPWSYQPFVEALTAGPGAS
jgi:hypothetical protein